MTTEGQQEVVMLVGMIAVYQEERSVAWVMGRPPW